MSLNFFRLPVKHGGQAGDSAAAPPTPDIIIVAESGRAIEIADPEILMRGDYHRDGADLWLIGPDGTVILITGYFAVDAPGLLVAPTGVQFDANLVSILSGSGAPKAYAQADGEAETEAEAETLGGPIGRVEIISGTAVVRHLDDTSESITLDTKIYQGDLIETEDGAALGLVLGDDTTVAMV
jgi:hypothetical protein